MKEIIDNATATGADPTVSDAYTINGQPGFPNNCSNGMKYQCILKMLLLNEMSLSLSANIGQQCKWRELAHHFLIIIISWCRYFI